eukprot:6185264-Pleurochrysis_carterae.AAC.1
MLRHLLRAKLRAANQLHRQMAWMCNRRLRECAAVAATRATVPAAACATGRCVPVNALVCSREIPRLAGVAYAVAEEQGCVGGQCGLCQPLPKPCGKALQPRRIRAFRAKASAASRTFHDTMRGRCALISPQYLDPISSDLGGARCMRHAELGHALRREHQPRGIRDAQL